MKLPRYLYIVTGRLSWDACNKHNTNFKSGAVPLCKAKIIKKDLEKQFEKRDNFLGLKPRVFKITKYKRIE